MHVNFSIMLFVYPLLVGLSDVVYAEGGKGLETVRGHACYGFGDDQTPAQARRGAMMKAQEDAVRHHGVFVKSSSRIKNFQMEEDIVQTASAAMLQEIIVEKEERKPQELCIALRAKISPISVEDMITQRIAAKEITREAQTTLVPSQPGEKEDMEAIQKQLNKNVLERPFSKIDTATLDAYLQQAIKNNTPPPQMQPPPNWQPGWTCGNLMYSYYQYRNCLHYYRYYGYYYRY